MKKIFTLLFVVTLSVVEGSISLFAQTSISLIIGVPYQQDFNTLIASGNSTWADTVLLPAWYSNENNIYADDGNDVFGGRLHSYGSGISTERALGGKAFSSLSEVAIAVRVKNNSNNTINYFQISFRGEQWRQNTNANTLKFYYQINAPDISNGTWTPVTSLDFPELYVGSAMALDGNLSANDTSFLAVIPLTLNPGQEVWFKWEIIGNSNGPGLAIDDLEIIPSATNPTSASNFSSNNNELFCFYSNSSNSIILNTNFSEEDFLVIHIYDAFGKNVKTFSEKILAGKNQTSIRAGNLSKGIYFISASGSKKSFSAKVAVY